MCTCTDPLLRGFSRFYNTMGKEVHTGCPLKFSKGRNLGSRSTALCREVVPSSRTSSITDLAISLFRLLGPC